MIERDIFLAVLDLPDSAARASYLDHACGGDTALRTQVEALLRSHATAGNFLDSPVVAPMVFPAAAASAFGSEAMSDDHANVADVLTFLAPSVRPDALGRIGHYEVLEVLGRGGFGIVLRAFDEVLQRVVAVKVLSPLLAATSPARKRFLREARSSAKVRHENVVQVYAVEEQPLPYLVMEYIPGETLQQRLDRTGPLEPLEVVQIGRQIAEGLAAAHGMGLIHRDIKPGNILLETGPHPRVKLTDFGLARAADDASLTQSGVVAGTPLFMAPEQATGAPIDHRADLFSLGSVLYTLTSGRPPFRAANSLAVLKRVAEDTPRPIPEIIPDVPAWLCDLISKLHAKKPEERFATAREVADLLARCAAEKQQPSIGPLLVHSTPTPRASVRPLPPRRRPWAFAAVLLLALFGLGITEAVGVTNVRGTVLRLFSPEGTLVVEVDDPGVSITIDGEELVITGTGVKEIRLKPGHYQVKASKDGQTVREELVRVERHGKQVVRVRWEEKPGQGNLDAAAWEQSVAALPAEEQLKAVVARLKHLNAAFDGIVTPTVERGVVVGLRFSALEVTDLSPVRAFRELRSLYCGSMAGDGKLTDLSPLRGMQLTTLVCNNTQVADLAPLQGMRLKELAFQHTRVSNLAPLADMPLEHLNCSHTTVADLAPLKGKMLITLYLDSTRVSDLAPLQGMPLKIMNCRGVTVDLKREHNVLISLTALEEINSEPVAEVLEKLGTAKEMKTK